MNEEVFEEYNSNNNEEERIKKVFELEESFQQKGNKLRILTSKDNLGDKIKYSSFIKSNESNRDQGKVKILQASKKGE